MAAPSPMLGPTRNQLAYATTCYEKVAELDTIPADHKLQLATMLRLGSPARAAWWLASYLEKPGRIPKDFGTLLDLDPDVAIAAAVVARYTEQLRTVITSKVADRLLQMNLPA